MKKISNDHYRRKFKNYIRYRGPAYCEVEIADQEILRLLFPFLEELIRSGVKRVETDVVKTDGTSHLSEIARRLSSARYHFIDKMTIRIKDLPYCLVRQPESFAYFKKGGGKKFMKLPQCRKCKYGAFCRGISSEYGGIWERRSIIPVPDLPREVMFEVEEKCNLDCNFCFNKNTFAKHGRDIENRLSSPYLKKIIKDVSLSRIPIVRFTGGEPLLRRDIWELADYAKKQRLEVRINTNGTLIKNAAIARKVAKHFDNVLMPIHYFDVATRNSVARAKVRAIRLLKAAGTKKLRINTVATKLAILNLEKIYRFIKSLKVDKWEINRPIPNPQSKEEISRFDVEKLTDKLLAIRRQTGEDNYIVNAIPFCSCDPIKMKTVAIGSAFACDGHERLVVDPRGFAKPIYYMDKNIGDPTDILACWNHPFMKKMRNLGFVPKECERCIFLGKCRGGCRASSYLTTGSYKGLDPLADLNNKIV